MTTNEGASDMRLGGEEEKSIHAIWDVIHKLNRRTEA